MCFLDEFEDFVDSVTIGHFVTSRSTVTRQPSKSWVTLFETHGGIQKSYKSESDIIGESDKVNVVYDIFLPSSLTLGRGRGLFLVEGSYQSSEVTSTMAMYDFKVCENILDDHYECEALYILGD